MTREMLDQYLDGSLDNAARAAVERDLKSDPATVQLLARMRSERSARATALASYAPSPADARAFASQVMAACHEQEFARIAHISHLTWVKRIASVAAALIIAVGSYSLGQSRSQVPIVEVSAAGTVYNLVVSMDTHNEPIVQVFDSAEARDAYLRELDAPKAGVLALNTNEPGIF